MPPRPSLLQHFRLTTTRRNPLTARLFSTPPPPPPPPPPGSSSSRYVQTLHKVRARIHKLNDSLPPFLRAYTTPLVAAPSASIISFLILHELTALVPLVGLAADFHYSDRLPDFTSNAVFQERVQQLGKYLRKRGYVEDADVQSAIADSQRGPDSGEPDASEFEPDASEETAVVARNEGARLIMEIAAAYTIVKALLPLRIVVSVWATPWFARSIVVPVENMLAKRLRK